MHTTEARPFTAATSKFAFAQAFTAPTTRRNSGNRTFLVRGGRLSVLRRHARGQRVG
ncbi:MAG: hypothetical protein ABI345_07775 [Jatrophihabitans sp.]